MSASQQSALSASWESLTQTVNLLSELEGSPQFSLAEAPFFIDLMLKLLLNFFLSAVLFFSVVKLEAGSPVIVALPTVSTRKALNMKVF